MDASFFENLLNESESNYLDFKQEQYQFENALDDVKSELLKDILAFANAWRRTDAYVLLGIREVKGGRSEVLGISRHLDDASLQQFVNSKIQKPLSFSYIAYEFEGKQVGIIHIPAQDKPFYLRQNYGKLKKNVVYIRRGSSTDEAAPDEIAKMGVSIIDNAQTQLPKLDCKFADSQKKILIGNQIDIKSRVLSIPDTISKFKLASNPLLLTSSFSMPNRDFYSELFEFYDFRYLLKPINLRVINIGEVTAYNVHINICFAADDVVVKTKSDIPHRPRKYDNFIVPMANRVSVQAMSQLNSQITIHHLDKGRTISIDYGNIQPKAEEWYGDVLYIGSRKPYNLQFEAVIFADNIPDPIKIPLSIHFLTEDLNLTLNDLEKEHDAFLEEQLKALYEDYE